MFDRLIAWLTPQRRARIAFPVELSLGAAIGMVAILNSTSHGPLNFALAAFVSAALSTGVVLHRSRPDVALALLGSAPLAFVGPLVFGFQVNGAHYIAGAIIVFGTAAWGSPVIRLAGLATAFLLALLLPGWVLVVGYVYNGIFETLTYAFAPLVSWLLGELVRSIRTRRALTTAVETVSTERDAALTRADLEAERSRVARDVHDIVAHSLTVVIAQADGARYATASRDAQAAEAFETIARSARDALADVRVLLTELRHTQEAGPQPGLADLDGLLAAMRDSGLALETREFGDRGRLSEARQLALYRITQEALTNALRHGDGTAALELEWGATALDLVVTNPVRSGASASSSPDTGHGIDGMRERAALAGGELSIHYGEVVRLRARLPLDHAASETVPDDDAAPVLALEAGSRA